MSQTAGKSTVACLVARLGDQCLQRPSRGQQSCQQAPMYPLRRTSERVSSQYTKYCPTVWPEASARCWLRRAALPPETVRTAANANELKVCTISAMTGALRTLMRFSENLWRAQGGICSANSEWAFTRDSCGTLCVRKKFI